MKIVADPKEGLFAKRLLLGFIIAGWLLIIFGIYNGFYNLKPTSSISLRDGLAFLPAALITLISKYVELGGLQWRTGFREGMSGSDFLFITAFLAASQPDLAYVYQVEWANPIKIWWPVLIALISAAFGAVWIRKQALEEGWSPLWGWWCALMFAVVGGSTWMMENVIHANLGYTVGIPMIDKRFVASTGKFREHRMISVKSPSSRELIDWVSIPQTSWDELRPGDKIKLSYVRGGFGLDWWEYSGGLPSKTNQHNSQ